MSKQLIAIGNSSQKVSTVQSMCGASRFCAKRRSSSTKKIQKLIKNFRLVTYERVKLFQNNESLLNY